MMDPVGTPEASMDGATQAQHPLRLALVTGIFPLLILYVIMAAVVPEDRDLLGAQVTAGDGLPVGVVGRVAGQDRKSVV